MEKATIISLILIMYFFTSSHFSKAFIMPIKPHEKSVALIMHNENPIENSYENLDKLPQDYNYFLAVENGDVVSVQGIGYNVNKLNNFIEAFKSQSLKVGDILRITKYTIEGDPTIQDLIVDKGSIKLIIDNTRHKFGPIEDRKKTEYQVADIFVENKNNRIYYRVKTNTSEEIPLVTFKIIKTY